MANENKTVTLKRTANGRNHDFNFQHALNLLRLQEKNTKKGWVISDKNYIFENGEIIRKPSNRKSKKADE